MGQRFAVFDIDGTLIRWQLYHAAVDELGKRSLLDAAAYQKVKEARMQWKRREHKNAFRTYERLLIKLYEQALPAITPAQFDEVAEHVAQEYKTQVYTYTRDLIQSLKQRNYFLLAISGSHRELIRHVAHLYGFDAWVGSEYERKAGQFTGKRKLASDNKDETLQRLVQSHRLTYEESIGVGDSLSDAAFLSLVKTPIVFNPTEELLQLAKARHWQIIIERKNVIYRLEWHDGKYILA